MIDPDLSFLHPDPCFEGCLQGVTVYREHKIHLRVDPDGADIADCLALAKKLANSLPLLDTKARAVAADKLLENYNQNWRMFQRVRPDGTTEDVTKPALSAAEFDGRLQLEAVSVTGNMIEFCFSNDGLFAGHSVFVSSFDGTDFKDTDASLFG